MKRLWLCALVTIAACGAPEALPTATFSVSWQEPLLACEAEATLAERLEVWLQIGSYDPCQLNVNPGDLTATNECGEIMRGTVWPVALTYRMRAPAASMPSVPLAYFIGYLNLCEGSVDDDAKQVDLEFVNDGITSKFFYLPSELASLPQGRATPSCANRLEESLLWAATNLIGSSPAERLDANCDCVAEAAAPSGCSNLEEACANTLFTAPSACGG